MHETFGQAKRGVPWSRLTEILKKHEERIAKERRMLSWEVLLEKRIRDAGFKSDAFKGITTHDERKAYFRSIINMHNLADKPCGKSTFRKAFETVYREQL